MANVYTIGSEKGYNIVNMLKPGQSTNNLSSAYRPSDGSVWTKQNDGTISVLQNGQTLVGDVTYRPQTQPQPQQQQQNTYGTGSGGNRNTNSGGTYNIGSAYGYELVNGLQPGQSTNKPTDGSVWTKNADGTITVRLADGSIRTGNITYQPPEQVQPTVQQPITATKDYGAITPGQSQLVYPSQSPNRFNENDIKALYEAMQQQQQSQIDYSVQQAVQELQRAQEDAQKGFESQRNQVNIDEAQARDAEVLYAAARGDRGGITARQYNSISNTAARNRAAISDAQQKLSTDTARQIADLRAQGEFEKADALLQIAQQQLAQLWELQQYNDNLMMNEQQLAMQESALTGSYGGQLTLDAQLANRDWAFQLDKYNQEFQYQTQQTEREWAYELAMQSIQAGIVPDASTLSAAGLSQDMANQLASAYKTALSAKSSSGGGGGGSPTKENPYGDFDDFKKEAVARYEDDGPEAAADYLLSLVAGGYITEDEANAIGNIYLSGMGDLGTAPIDTVPTTYQEFVAATGYSGIMTPSEWARSGTKAHGSYQAYLAAMYEKYK